MTKEIKIPDIGGAKQVDVIAVLIKAGDTIAIDTPLATLEGDKASMDIPSSDAGVVESVLIKVGDKVSEGSVICTIQSSETKSDVKTVLAVAPAEKHDKPRVIEEKPRITDHGSLATN